MTTDRLMVAGQELVREVEVLRLDGDLILLVDSRGPLRKLWVLISVRASSGERRFKGRGRLGHAPGI